MINKKFQSKKYLEHLEYYRKMHDEGFIYKSGIRLTPKETYNGSMTITYAAFIKNIIEKNRLNSLLEYGCGKATFYEKSFKVANKNYPPLNNYWNLEIRLFDPGVKKFSAYPLKQSDITISIDVLEHIPEEDMDWVLSDIMNLSKKFVFLVIGSYPAQALLPNGKGAHVLIKDPKWWFEKLLFFKKQHMHLKILSICIEKDEENNIIHTPIEIDDKIKNYI